METRKARLLRVTDTATGRPDAFILSGAQRDSREYSVKRGDWVSRIAAKRLGSPLSWKEVAVVNGMDRPDSLEPGQKLALYPADLSKYGPDSAGQQVAESEIITSRMPRSIRRNRNIAPPPAQAAARGKVPAKFLLLAAATPFPRPGPGNAAAQPSVAPSPDTAANNMVPPNQMGRKNGKKGALDTSKLLEQNLPFLVLAGGVIMLLVVLLAVNKRRRARQAEEAFNEEGFSPKQNGDNPAPLNKTLFYSRKLSSPDTSRFDNSPQSGQFTVVLKNSSQGRCMNLKNCLFTSESVTEGHPDKLADQISDAVLDSLLAQDPRSRVACETLVTTGLAFVSGEITTTAVIDVPEITRNTIKRVGYNSDDMGFDYKTCSVLTAIGKQSPDISQGVTEGQGLFKEQGAGDQGLMFGYACDETPEYMPATLAFAHRLTKRLSECRKEGVLAFLRPDGKAQVTIQYENASVKRVEAIVVSTQHSPDVSYDELKAAVMEEVVQKSVPTKLIDSKTKIYINPPVASSSAAQWEIVALPAAKSSWTPMADTGHTAAAPFRAKTPRKSIDPLLTWADTSRKISSRRAWQDDVWCRSPMRLGWPSLFR